MKLLFLAVPPLNVRLYWVHTETPPPTWKLVGCGRRHKIHIRIRVYDAVMRKAYLLLADSELVFVTVQENLIKMK
jgi:hypothetical protein